MKRNDYEMTAQLELDHIPAAVEDRLRQIYAELPEEAPGVKARRPRPLWLTRTCAGLASAAAAFLVLVGMNGVSPALAEGLPFIGGVFQAFNRGITANNLWDTQAGLANYAEVPAGENSVQVPAGGLGQKPLTISVDQVYYDGVFVYAGLVMDLDAGTRVYSDDWGKYYNVYINGEPQLFPDSQDYTRAEGFSETVANSWWQRVEGGRYISQRGFRVPEKYQNQESLDITLCGQGISEYISDPLTEEKYIGCRQLNNTPYQLSFTVEKNQAQVRAITETMEINGITFRSAQAGPAGSTFTFDVSGQYHNPARVLRFEDGRELGVAGAGDTTKLEDGSIRQTWMMGGIQPGETRKVVLGIFDKNDTQDWLAVFLLDFEKGTVEAGSPEDILPAPHASYACGVDAVEGLTEGYLVSQFFYREEKNSMFLLTPEDYRDLKVELWQNGRLVDSAETKKDEFHWESSSSYWEYTPQSDGVWVTTRLTDLPLNRYFLIFERLAGFDADCPATVKVIDRATGDTVLEQFMEWNQPASGDPAVTIIQPEYDPDETIVDEGQEGAVSSQAE